MFIQGILPIGKCPSLSDRTMNAAGLALLIWEIEINPFSGRGFLSMHFGLTT